MSHFNTGPGWPQTRAEVEALAAVPDDDLLGDFMGQCSVEPADFENCLACYAYQLAQIREGGGHSSGTLDPIEALADELHRNTIHPLPCVTDHRRDATEILTGLSSRLTLVLNDSLKLLIQAAGLCTHGPELAQLQVERAQALAARDIASARLEAHHEGQRRQIGVRQVTCAICLAWAEEASRGH